MRSSSSLSQAITRPKAKPRFQECTGFPFWDEDRPNKGLSHYPWALHDANMLPWDPEVLQKRLYLRSHHCLEEVKITDTASSAICSSCNDLQYTPQYRNLVSRITNGCHESTKLVYQTMAQVVEKYRRRTRQYDNSRLTSLNAGRKLLVHAKEMDSYKRVLAAIASGEVKRVHAVLTVARRNGSGIHGIAGIINQAIDHLYSVKSFSEAEYHKAELAMRLGGAQLCEILHRADGLPAPRTVRTHSSFVQLLPSPSYPTVAEITTNIQRSFTRPLQHAESPGKVGAVLMIDEIALDKRYRWDPATNKLLGICREHGAQNISLEIGSLDDMDAANAAIADGRCHLASEVCFAPSRFTDDVWLML